MKIQSRKSRDFIIGTQGWNYADWTTTSSGPTIFYPRGTKSGEMLGLYAKIFDSVEVDSTFYAIPAASTLDAWIAKTPEDFTFSLKLPRAITHDLHLGAASFEMADEFFARAAMLREKLAVVLIQLPPDFGATRENAIRLRRFLERLPRDLRFAVEFRDRGWMAEWTFTELARFGVAPALVEGSWIAREEMFAAIPKIATSFSYVRFMGDRDLTRFDAVQRDQAENLGIWHDMMRTLPSEANFIYFSNFYEGHAPASAFGLQRLASIETVHPESLERQASLFDD